MTPSTYPYSATCLTRLYVAGRPCRSMPGVHCSAQCRALQKALWIETTSKDAFTKAVECGVDTFIKESDTKRDWSTLANATVYNYAVKANASVVDIIDGDGEVVGARCVVSSGEQLQQVQKRKWDVETVVVDATDWSIIPAENLVASFQQQSAAVLVYADSASAGKTLLGALECGVDGVVLRTDDIREVHAMAQYVSERNAAGMERLAFDVARVTRIEQLGMGDRVCVDLCSNLSPGEGLLVGNFSRALFLVHSECAESSYINARPFRVNAGPVHAYLSAPADRTAYLSELRSGHDVLVVSADGATRAAITGRCKVESRPLTLVEAATDDGLKHSIIVQNAETVKLVGPAHGGADKDGPAWKALPVTDLKEGDELFVKLSDAARHMGMSIVERIAER